MTVAWALLAPDGTISKGSGQEPPAGWFDHVRHSLGLALQVPGFPPAFVVRPTCSNDVERRLAGEIARFWGVTPEPGAQVWFFPSGMIGVGQDTNEVERLVDAFRGKLEAEEVARGPDQRGRTE